MTGTFQNSADAHDPLKDLDDRIYQLRKAFERTIRGAIQAEHGEQAPKIAESVTGYVFDFGDFDFDQRTVAEFKKACEFTLRHAYLVIDTPPEAITAAIVHRGWRQGRALTQVVGHLANLFDLSLAILGQRARAAGPMLYSVHKDLFFAVCQTEPPVEKVARFLTHRSDGQAARARHSGGDAAKPAGNPPAAAATPPSGR